MANEKFERPDKSITLENSGKEIVMTYVCINDILRFVGPLDAAITNIMIDSETRDLIIRRLLTDSKKPIESFKDLIGPEEVDIDVFDIEDIMAWVLDHVTYFFMRTAEKMEQMAEKYPETLPQATAPSDPSTTGSIPSET